MNISPKYTTFPSVMIKLAGFFNPLLKELHEMLYQNDRDYYFNSSKFSKRFSDFKTTSYEEGVKAVMQDK